MILIFAVQSTIQTVKNLSIILNIVLAAAIVVLFILHFNDGDSGEHDGKEEMATETGNYKIAYILSDTLLANYQYVLDENAKLRKRSDQIQTDYRNRAEGLQKELNDYQTNYANLTIGQARAIEENLTKKEQNLRLFQQSVQQELLELESKISRELYTKLTGFLKEYSERKGIEMVVKFDTSSDVLYAGEGLDITREVLDSLNARYLNPTPVKTATDSTSN